jgi:hypothetical protein
VAGLERRDIPEGRDRERAARDPEDREVGGRIAPLQGSADALAVRQRDGDILVAAHGSVRGDHESVSPMHSGGGELRSGVHGDDALRSTLHRASKLIREVDQGL